MSGRWRTLQSASALVLGMVTCTGPATAADTNGDFPGRESIRSADLMRTVERLAAPDLQGRLAGGPGYTTAAKEMAEQFRQLGLRTPADGSYFQDLAIEYNDIEECRLALVRSDGTTDSLVLGRDFACRGLTGSGDLTAPVIFLGYGLCQPEKGLDDYAGVDVRGKVVLAFKEAPPFQHDSTGWGEAWMPRPKGRVAAAHGAVALLIVPRPNQEYPQKPIGSMLEGEAETDVGFPRMQVDGSVAETMVQTIGRSLKDLEATIDSTRAPYSLELKISARIRVRAHYEPQRPSVNVVGILEGSDPRLKNETVVVGAHLDHVGRQGDRVYFPGANDNASGSASVLAIAKAFTAGGALPRRSVIFGLWSSEESGLFGTKRLLEQPPVARDGMVAYLNFDCVGHGDSIEVGGGKEYPRLWELARGIDRDQARLMVKETGEGGGADAEPFEEAKIPNLYFASKFSYTYLHQTGDTPATLNPPLLEAIARLGYATAWKIANGAPLGGTGHPNPAGQ